MSVNDNNVLKTDIRHIAFIMDGNGRWAQRRNMPREYGHKHGAKALKRVIERCFDYGIEAATFYAFSTENWKRPKKEVDAIMNLLDTYLDEITSQIKDNDIRYNFIGDVSVLNDSLCKKIKAIEQKTLNNKFIINIALNYSSKSELVMVYNKLIEGGRSSVTADDIEAALYTADSPPLDLIVRTGGEYRLSNFLLWQAAYAELYFTDVLWPDMDHKDVDEAIKSFNNRNRRFGGV